jgi:gas vesicle protein GvpL/GvpF
VSHLVERDAVDEYRRLVDRARAERPELHFLLSGPWAPYSFANIDLEFKTQFGVS